jgi:uncharacterized SAM-binding protein YcdF (DUF218 family)
VIWSIGSIFKQAFLPPLLLGWVALFGFLLLRRKPRLGRWLLGISLGLGYVAASPWFGEWLMNDFVLDRKPPAASQPQAIVVLGGGRKLRFDDSGKAVFGTVAGETLERLMTGAQLQRLTKLPVLVTGGKPDGWDPPEGEVMQFAMEKEFGVPVRWAEKASRNTVENARFSAPMLRRAGVKTIFLVTTDSHMRRARVLFEGYGFEVRPVFALYPLAADGSMLPVTRPPFRWRNLVPDMGALHKTYFACNELAGMIYARMNLP